MGITTGVNLNLIEAIVLHPLHILLIVRWRLSCLHADAGVQITSDFETKLMALVHQRLHIWKTVLSDYGFPILAMEGAMTSKTEVGARWLRSVEILANTAIALLPAIV